jgi:hypothetical protein
MTKSHIFFYDDSYKESETMMVNAKKKSIRTIFLVISLERKDLKIFSLRPKYYYQPGLPGYLLQNIPFLQETPLSS